MTEIYKISVKNKDLLKLLKGADTWYFETKEAAEATMSAINSILAKGKKIEWECTIISVMSKEDALKQFLSFSKSL